MYTVLAIVSNVVVIELYSYIVAIAIACMMNPLGPKAVLRITAIESSQLHIYIIILLPK